MANDKSIYEELILSPVTDAGTAQVQSKLFEVALDTPSVHNIAVTGPFGSGKSSFVKSFEKDGKEQFAYVSLADFDLKSKNPNDASNKAYLLERKIIDQLSARAAKDGSRKWSRTRYSSEKVERNRRALSATCLATLVLVVSFTALCGSFLSAVPDDASRIWVPVVIAAVDVLLIVVVAVWFVCSGCPPIIKSFSIEGATAELEGSVANESFFDEHLSFIIELFDSRDERVYVFEDLDRMNNDELFVRLRELNAVLNNFRSSDKPIKFVYCLGDNVLLGESRTKFFDMVIPVVPIMSGYNSYEFAASLLNKNGVQADDKFLRNIALYIDDFRLLKTTVADFLVYRDVLLGGTNGLNDVDYVARQNKLLAVMAIKNVAPTLFCDLQAKQGSLYDLLDNLSSEASANECGVVLLTEKKIQEVVGAELKGDDVAGQKRVSDLIGYLINNRFLGEDFAFYLARPDEESLSSQDRQWLISARNGSQNILTKLDSPEVVFNYLQDHELLRPEMLNISLASWLMSPPLTSTAISSITKASLADGGSNFAETAINEIPRFPFVASSCNPKYYSAICEHINKASRGLFSLSVACGSSAPKNFIEIDSANNGELGKTLQAHAGAFTASIIERYKLVFGDVEEKLTAILAELGLKVDILAPEAAPGLLRTLVNNGLYVQNEPNCRIALSLDTPISDSLETLDLLYKNQDSRACGNCLKNLSGFVSEYLADTEGFVCSNEALAWLLSNCQDTNSKKSLLVGYREKIQTLGLIAVADDVELAASTNIVAATTDNAMDYLRRVDADELFVKLANESQMKGLDKLTVDQVPKDYIKSNVVPLNDIDLEPYSRIIALLDKHSLSSIPNTLDSDHLNELFNALIPELNASALQTARHTIKESARFTFICSDLDAYVRCVNSSGQPSETDEEIVAVAKATVDPRTDYLPKLVSLIRGKVPLSDEVDDELLVSLLDEDKLEASSFTKALQRYGRNDELDSLLIGLIPLMQIDIKIFSKLSPDLIAAAIADCDQDRKCDLVESASLNGSLALEIALKGLGSPKINSLLEGKRPLYSELDGSEQSIVIRLEQLKRCSISKNDDRIRYKSAGRRR